MKFNHIFCLSLLIITINKGFSQCHIDDWTALKALYESTVGDIWKNNPGWEDVKEELPPPDCDLARLYGVDLDNNGRVSSIVLNGFYYPQGNKLSGNIPAELGNLTNLKLLSLSHNDLSGNVPAELSNLANLESLSLSGNNLSGSIPAELSNLANLESLDLSGNNLSGSIPAELSNLTNLERLSLSGNNLSGSIPAEFSNLTNLESLYLSGNDLSGSIPAELSNLTNLERLYLSGNNLSGSIPAEFSNLTNLKSLYLYSNELSGIYPPEIFRLCDQIHGSIDAANNFDVTWNAFCTWGNYAYTNVCNLEDWTALKALYESTDGDNWKIRSGWETLIYNISAPPSNCNLRKLYGVELDSFRVNNLDLVRNDLIGSIPVDLSKLTNLESLDLSSNQISGSIPSELDNLTNLESLDLSSNQISGSIPGELGNLTNLIKLHLSSNQLSGSIPGDLSNLTNLKSLTLAWNQLSGIYPSEIFRLCDQLSSHSYSVDTNNNFDVSWKLFCLIGDRAYVNACDLEDWTALKALYESTNGDNWIKRSGWDTLINDLDTPPTNCDLRKLFGVTLDSFRVITLNLPANNLRGGIPAKVLDLSNLTNLGLQGNQLSGSLPSKIGNFTNLTSLDLSGNKLIGSLPSTLGNLTNLTVLDLSSNKLNDGLPATLGDLTNLTDLILYDNQLSGSLPAEFSNFTNLRVLWLSGNQFSGSIPVGIDGLNSLRLLRVINNYFLCEDVPRIFHPSNLQEIHDFSYSWQFFKPANYNDIKSNIFDTLTIERRLNIQIDFPFDTTGFTFQWFRNGNPLPGATQATLNIDTVKSNNTGKYTLRLAKENCLADGNSFQTTSEPIYVLLKGYDLVGQPVNYTQLMVEYENKQTKDLYEQEIFFDNGGIWADKCDCNRELHLYTFPNDSSSIEQAYIALDKKIKSIRPRSNIDGGFNYKLNNISLNASFVKASAYRNPLRNFRSQNGDNIAYTVQYDYQTVNYSDEVRVYILDSGLDERNFSGVNDFLLANAPVDSCYNISASGYNFTTVVPNLKDYTETVDTNFQDSEGHGTFGFRSISQGLQEANNAKIIPLKIIESATNGNLFDLVCSMYHAIDHSANVINLSAGYKGEASGILADAINKARQKGIFVVTAAGNDNLNIDHGEVVPQYPAYYASQLHEFYEYNNLGVLDTIFTPYDNLITVGAVNANNQLNVHSNYGAKSVTLAAPGENIFGYGLEGEAVIGTGTSIAAFLTTQVLAREIARDNSRTFHEIRADFESRYLVSNPNLTGFTSTGKQINFDWTGAEVTGCTDCTACNYFPYATKDDGSCLPDFISTSDVNEKLVQANDSIVANQVIQPFDTVAYKAGQQIILENGFEVNTNTSFSAEIKCGIGSEVECGE